MGSSAGPCVLLALACAFSSCCAEVTQAVKMSLLTTSFEQAATSAQPPSLHHSPSRGDATLHVNSTSAPRAAPRSRTTPVRAASRPAAAAQPPHATAQATRVGEQAAPAATATSGATAAAGPSSNGAGQTATPAAADRTVHLLCTTGRTETSDSTASAGGATNTTRAPARTTKQMAVVITTTATNKTTVKTTRGPANHTTAPQTTTTTAVATTTTVHPKIQTTIPSTTTTGRPTPAPQPSAIPTGTYTVRNGSATCIRAVMGLQLMAQNIQKKQPEYVNINPNRTQVSGSCGMRQSTLNITFSGGFVNLVFVKKTRMYYVGVIEASLQSEGMLYYAVLQEQMFTTKLGNSFKCASKQVFSLEKGFQLLTVNMQLQAFDIVGNQFGKVRCSTSGTSQKASYCVSRDVDGKTVACGHDRAEKFSSEACSYFQGGKCSFLEIGLITEEECYLDRNSKAVPVAVGLSILGLFVIVLVTFVISRRKPNRGYERI